MPDSIIHTPSQTETAFETSQAAATAMPAAEAASAPRAAARQQRPRKEYDIPATIARPATPAGKSYSIPSTIARPDSLAQDSVKQTPARKGIVMVDPFDHNKELPARPDTESPVSWVIAGLILLFCIAGLRYKSNALYLRGMMRDTVEVRERGNMFDETVRETAFMIILLLICGVALGILVYVSLPMMGFAVPASVWGLPLCLGCTVAYMTLMPLFYKVMGTVFLTPQLSREWIKGFTAGMGLLSIPAFPLALVALFSPEAARFAVIAAAICLAAAKILFIFRSFRIFMTESSSWVLFLYYLCNLEIVPLTTTYVGAIWLCASIT